MRLFISGIWFLLAVACSYADTYLRQPAVDIVHYDIALELTRHVGFHHGNHEDPCAHAGRRRFGHEARFRGHAGGQPAGTGSPAEVSRCATAACRLISGENMRGEKSQSLRCATTASLSMD